MAMPAADRLIIWRTTLALLKSVEFKKIMIAHNRILIDRQDRQRQRAGGKDKGRNRQSAVETNAV